MKILNKEKIIEILEDYEFFVDDDFGGHYEHINCSQKALTPLGILEILDCIDNLEIQLKKQQEIIDKIKKAIKGDIDGFMTINEHGESETILELLKIYLELLEDKEV